MSETLLAGPETTLSEAANNSNCFLGDFLFFFLCNKNKQPNQNIYMNIKQLIKHICIVD